MKSHLVEIYLDSYNSEPFVTEFSEDSAIDSSVGHWLKRLTGKQVNVETQLRVADVRHPATKQHETATQLRVQVVS